MGLNTATLLIASLVAIGPQIELGERGQVEISRGQGRPDAIFETSRGAAVAWVQTIVPAGDTSPRNVCHLSGLSEEAASRNTLPQWHQESFREAAAVTLCCVDRTVIEPVGRGRSLAVTTCSMRQGFWLWSQALSAGGQPEGVPAPVLPVLGRAQHAPKLAPAPGDGLWLAWVEGEHSPDVGGIVRAARIDASGEVIAGPFDLSEGGNTIAHADMLRDGLAISAIPGGGVAVAWYARSGRNPRGLHFRLLDSTGRPTTPELQGTPEGHERADSPRIHVGERGPLTLAWQRRSANPDAPSRVFVRNFTLSGEPISGALPVSVDEPERSQELPRIVVHGRTRFLVWHERSRSSREHGRSWIALRRWSPDAGPIGLTTRFSAELAEQWPLLEALPDDDTDNSFTLYWHPDRPAGFADPGRIAWRQVVVPVQAER